MEKDIGKINKNDMSDILLRIDDFGNRKGLTIREFITSDRYTGFTKSGVKIMAADFPKFKEMINSITEEDLKEEPTEPTQPEPEQKILETSEQEKEPAEIKTEKPGESTESLPDY